ISGADQDTPETAPNRTGRIVNDTSASTKKDTFLLPLDGTIVENATAALVDLNRCHARNQPALIIDYGAALGRDNTPTCAANALDRTEIDHRPGSVEDFDAGATTGDPRRG